MEKNINENAAKVPEQEAGEIRNMLRRKLSKVPLSVSGFVDKKNRRLIHIAADHPTNSDLSTDLYYKADNDVPKIVKDAISKITTRFEI